jgi:hypothetical protein
MHPLPAVAEGDNPIPALKDPSNQIPAVGVSATVSNGAPDAIPGTICGYCQHTMIPRHDKDYCCDACRNAAYYRDHPEKRKPKPEGVTP